MLRATAAFSPASPPAMADLVAAARMRVVEAGAYLFLTAEHEYSMTHLREFSPPREGV
jgi:hypothetical protein